MSETANTPDVALRWPGGELPLLPETGPAEVRAHEVGPPVVDAGPGQSGPDVLAGPPQQAGASST